MRNQKEQEFYELVEFLKIKDDGQSFLLSMDVVSLCRCQYLQDVADGALRSIWIAVKQHCSNASHEIPIAALDCNVPGHFQMTAIPLASGKVSLVHCSMSIEFSS